MPLTWAKDHSEEKYAPTPFGRNLFSTERPDFLFPAAREGEGPSRAAGRAPSTSCCWSCCWEGGGREAEPPCPGPCPTSDEREKMCTVPLSDEQATNVLSELKAVHQGGPKRFDEVGGREGYGLLERRRGAPVGGERGAGGKLHFMRTGGGGWGTECPFLNLTNTLYLRPLRAPPELLEHLPAPRVEDPNERPLLA